MSQLFSFSLSLPTGIEHAILLLFILLGLVNLLNIAANRMFRLLPIALLHISGGLFGVLARDLVALLISWEILTISGFFLIRFAGGNRSRQAALRYLAVQMVSAALFFIAAVIHYRAAGSLSVVPLTASAQPFMFAAILIKTAAVPLHCWLVESYPAAHPGITPLLSAYTTKIGVLSAARLLIFAPWGVPVLAYAGGLTAVIAVVFALKQQNARKLLSYHIVSQVGYMTAAIGLVGTVGNAAAVAGLFHLITHTMYKSLLFMTAAEARKSFGHDNLLAMGGLWRRRPGLFCCALVGAAAISGVPATSGYASKALLKTVTGSGFIQYLLLAASAGTALSFIKFIYLIFLAPERRTELQQTHPLSMAAPVLLTLATLYTGFRPNQVHGIAAGEFFSFTTVVNALPPLAIGGVLWILLKKRLTRYSQPLPLPDRLATPVSNWFVQRSWPIRHTARVLHAQGPQMQIAIALFTLVLTVWAVHQYV